jgi:hypothetical protein
MKIVRLKRSAVAALLVLLALSNNAAAQADESLDEVTVTGSRISYKDLNDTPAIGITKLADAITQGFVLDCDTRDEAQRRNELHATLKAIIEQTAGRFVVQTAQGLTLNRDNYRVDLSPGGKTDSSSVQFRLRALLKDRSESASVLVEQMRAYLESTNKVGRTELGLNMGTELSITKPERFRYELLAEIAKDVERVRTTFGASSCQVSIEGLNNRIEWERVSTGELLLYIRYTMQLKQCGVSGNTAQ